MNIEETAKVLTKIQLVDNRQVGKLTIAEWQYIIGHLNYSDAIEAVTMHRRESADYLQPAHIIANVDRVCRDLRTRAGDYLRHRYGVNHYYPPGNLEQIGRALPDRAALTELLGEYEQGRPEYMRDYGPLVPTTDALDVPVKFLTPGDGRPMAPDAWMNR